jgi:hypothetical protein
MERLNIGPSDLDLGGRDSPRGERGNWGEGVAGAQAGRVGVGRVGGRKVRIVYVSHAILPAHINATRTRHPQVKTITNVITLLDIAALHAPSYLSA